MYEKEIFCFFSIMHQDYCDIILILVNQSLVCYLIHDFTSHKRSSIFNIFYLIPNIINISSIYQQLYHQSYHQHIINISSIYHQYIINTSSIYHQYIINILTMYEQYIINIHPYNQFIIITNVLTSIYYLHKYQPKTIHK